MARRKRRRLRTVWRAFVVLAAAGFACAAYIYLTLPDVRVLRTENPQTTAFMELRARQAIAEGQPLRKVHRWVPYSRISQNLTRAVLVAEDSAFWQHEGVDFKQLQESMEINLERMEFYRGASTITQQLAKNLYLSPTKNPIRKARELLIARRLEAELSKQRIFELYLNVIEWGRGIYGAEAAARTYFGKSAADLSASEAALLAGAIINPRLLNPANPTPRLRRRQAMLLRRMDVARPPPVVAAPPVPADAESGPVAAPGDGGLPAVLPGEIVTPPTAPGGKPDGPPKGL
jgi:monofunctional biosynthetic peptidoglycan transglycosylase